MARMMQQDENAARRSSKLTVALRSFEDYVSEVVMSNHGMKQDEMVRIVQDNFRRSVQANVNYHEELAHAFDKDQELASANYHKIMAEVYRSLLK
jgi:hypothetical protein